MLNAFSNQPTPPNLDEIPLMGLGTFIGIEVDRIHDLKKRHEVTKATILTALAEGYRHLDLAANYGNLEAVAAALKEACLPKKKGGLGLKREDIWLTMKADGPFSQEHVESLLQQVGVDYFDLYLIHHVQAAGFENEHELEQNWRNLTNISKLKLKRIGVSNFYEPHLNRLLAICERKLLQKPYANEIELNLFCKNKGLMDYCQSHGIKIIAYSPLGYANAPSLLENEHLKALAKKLAATPAQAALAWMMEKGIAVIPKTTKVERLRENLQATSFIELVKKNHKLSAAIDVEPDVVDDGLTDTAIGSKAHGASLTWSVTATSIKKQV